MPPRDLQERTRLFAIAVVRFCRQLPNTDEAQEEARQLRRAATAVRRNYRAARRGRSRAEFEAKLGTVFEEADECVDCLESLRDTRIRTDAALINEARELASIFGKSVSTARKNTRRSKTSGQLVAEKWKVEKWKSGKVEK
jgi:four helix bundle protein